jgi:ribosomal protein S18 acetylase RimI-like enzyme
MNKALKHRKASIDDLHVIIELYLEDNLGKTRETSNKEINERYMKAFHQIDSDPNQYLMVIELGADIVGTCHLTIMPSLTFEGSTRMQIEAVRVSEKHRGHKIGEWMIQAAFDYAKERSATIIQLTTNKKRERAKKFYEQLGFEATHEGMKLYVR